MAKDPAFLFYPGESSEDTQFLNRLERGCYFDLLKAQKKHRRFSIELIRKVLGRDFETCWASIEPVLKKDEGGYFIEWVENSIEARATYSAKQKKRIEEYWIRKRAEEEALKNAGDTTEQQNEYTVEYPSLNECNSLGNRNRIGIGIKNKKEPISKPELFSELFSDDLYVEQLSMTHKGKDPKQAFEECYTHHSNAPNPPTEVWEWKQKLNTWLSIKRNDKPKSNLKITPEGTLERHRRYGK